jgi:hypothetical protein
MKNKHDSELTPQRVQQNEQSAITQANKVMQIPMNTGSFQLSRRSTT